MAEATRITASGPWVVVSQAREDCPAKDYRFTDKAQALMFLAMCDRDGDFRCYIATGAA